MKTKDIFELKTPREFTKDELFIFSKMEEINSKYEKHVIILDNHAVCEILITKEFKFFQLN